MLASREQNPTQRQAKQSKYWEQQDWDLEYQKCVSNERIKFIITDLNKSNLMIYKNMRKNPSGIKEKTRKTRL